MQKINTQLPPVLPPKPPKVDWFSRHYLWGYAFLVLAFVLAVALIYQLEYGRKPKESRICIQVITPAKNSKTGETKEFPTPCDVPEGWEPVNTSIDCANEPELSYECAQLGVSATKTYQNEEYDYGFDYYIEYWELQAVPGGDELVNKKTGATLFPQAYASTITNTVNNAKKSADIISDKKMTYGSYEWRQINFIDRISEKIFWHALLEKNGIVYDFIITNTESPDDDLNQILSNFYLIDNSSFKELKFSGKIQKISDKRPVDGFLVFTVNSKTIVADGGFMLSNRLVGTVSGYNFDNPNQVIGKTAEVYTREIETKDDLDGDYTLFGKKEYYIKIK